MTEDRTGDLACCDKDAQVVADRWDEFLHDRSVRLVPGPLREFFEGGSKRRPVVAAVDVFAASAEARLDNDRRRKRTMRAFWPHVEGSGTADPFPAEQPCCTELVMGCDQRRRVVEDRDPSRLERPQCPQAIVDTVQARPDVQASESDIPSA
jgi:hypothetical protein